ncbi:glycine cleavage system protein H [Ramlibacter sp. G-1-2-2]|uniref:Glycine cleavage system protein H n=1 Tax=Ramlibacter agri TaxID=2728837 RepID=A0A848H6L1_9BURK|nr:glycine cleavage system protein H [Ramlibacter agri]NML46616.1 glycine cleavage system protein H [Ramlibacter agri]
MDVLGFAWPEDCFHFLSHDMWCRPWGDGCMEVGVSAFGVHLSGDFYMCRPKPVGTRVTQGETLAVAELSKCVVAIKSPLTGEVSAVNPLLAETPEVVHLDPFGRGWLVRIAVSRWDADRPQLAHGGGLEAAVRARVQMEDL